MPQTSFALLTNLGRAKEAAALANATTITITHIAIGDGATVPSGGETALYNQVALKTVSGHGTVVGADNVAYFDCYLAAGDGPYTIREAGLIDDEGDLIAIAHYDPAINKPVPSSGQTVEGTVRLEVAFSNIATVVIVVDPSIQVALQRLTRLPWIPIIELYRNAPPASPAVGDCYVIGPSPSGSWTRNAGKVAEFTIAGWAMITPPAGHGVSIPDGRIYELVSGSYIEKVALDAQSGKWHTTTDTGSANAIVGALTPAPAAYTKGMLVVVQIKNANTGATTANFNGLGVKNVVHPDGSALVKYDLAYDAMAGLVYDGTSFQLAWTQRQPGSLGPVTRVLLVSATTTVTTAANEVAVHARAWGPGGGGGGSGASGAGSGGGGSEYAEGFFPVTPSTAYTATIGAGGLGGVAMANGTDGGTTSFGSLITANGGTKGYAGSGAIMTTPGSGGTGGTGGPIRFAGSSGGTAVKLGTLDLYVMAIGGYSYGRAILPLQYVPLSAVVGTPGSQPGNGGGGGFHTANGGNGFAGMLILTFYAK